MLKTLKQTKDWVANMWTRDIQREVMHALVRDYVGVPVALIGHGKVEWIDQEGVSDLGTVWSNHGGHIRYIVMKEKRGYCLYDFDTASLDKDTARVSINDPEIFPTEESAVMAATLQI